MFVFVLNCFYYFSVNSLLSSWASLLSSCYFVAFLLLLRCFPPVTSLLSSYRIVAFHRSQSSAGRSSHNRLLAGQVTIVLNILFLHNLYIFLQVHNDYTLQFSTMVHYYCVFFFIIRWMCTNCILYIILSVLQIAALILRY